ncbi:hypothetical protein [Streptomyces sp. GbtcB7]|nr:hypothetical protein [Streptomyces sp. GbtcB7]
MRRHLAADRGPTSPRAGAEDQEVVRVRGQSAQGPVGTGTDHPADDGDL